MAFESAWEMARAVEAARAGPGDWAAALDTFERERKPRAELVQLFSVLVGTTPGGYMSGVFPLEVMAAMGQYMRTYPERADIPPPEEVVAYFAANDVYEGLDGVDVV
jgi:2-polyprenyl-6-methoxyphenol hydroxylase-like FAD-dependent oxidoreductase